MKTFFSRLPFSRAIKRQARIYAAQGKPLNIMTDTVFKAVFASDDEDSRAALRSLLSCIIHREVSHLRIMNSEIPPDLLKGKTVRLDIHATFNDGEQADLEMQIGLSGDDLKTRAAFYAARLLSGQGKRGEPYRGLKRVYQIFFLNSVLFPGSEKIPRRYFLKEEKEQDKLSEVVEVIFYELPKVEKEAVRYIEGVDVREVENLSPEEKWCIYMKYRHEERAGKLMEKLSQEEGIMSAERVLERVNRDYEKWARQLFREKAEMDYYAGIASARLEGRAEGETQGYERARGEYEEIRWRERQEYEKKLVETARRMKTRGLPPEEIAEDTGLPLETVEKL